MCDGNAGLFVPISIDLSDQNRLIPACPCVEKVESVQCNPQHNFARPSRPSETFFRRLQPFTQAAAAQSDLAQARPQIADGIQCSRPGIAFQAIGNRLRSGIERLQGFRSFPTQKLCLAETGDRKIFLQPIPRGHQIR